MIFTFIRCFVGCLVGQALIEVIKHYRKKVDLEPKTIADKAREADNQLSHGEKTLNQVREEFGLAPIDDESANTLFVVSKE